MLKKVSNAYHPIPVIQTIDPAMIQRNHIQIKHDIQDVIQPKMERFSSAPTLAQLVIEK